MVKHLKEREENGGAMRPWSLNVRSIDAPVVFLLRQWIFLGCMDHPAFPEQSPTTGLFCPFDALNETLGTNIAVPRVFRVVLFIVREWYG